MGNGHELDEIDRRLLELLQLDCKTALSRLGDDVGLSAPAVMERVRKLEQAAVITGYHARVDPVRVGLGITAFIGLSINYPKDIQRFVAELAKRPEVLECHHITGGHSLLLKVRTQNTATLEGAISALREVEGVTQTETMVVLSTASEKHHVPTATVAPPIPPSPKAGRRNGRPSRRGD